MAVMELHTVILLMRLVIIYLNIAMVNVMQAKKVVLKMESYILLVMNYF